MQRHLNLEILKKCYFHASTATGPKTITDQTLKTATVTKKTAKQASFISKKILACLLFFDPNIVDSVNQLNMEGKSQCTAEP